MGTKARSIAALTGAIYLMMSAVAMAENNSTLAPLAAVVLVAQANTGQQIAKDGHILGVCDVVNVNGYPQLDASPMTLSNAYFHTHDATIDPATAIITTLQQPKHGYLKPDSRGDWAFAKYVPNDGYLGDDSFVMQVEGSGHTVKLKYFIAVTNDFGITENPNPICKGQIWKISQSPNGNSILTAVNYPSPFTGNTGNSSTDTAALASTLESSILSTLSVDPSLVTFNLADLAGGAVGQAVGTNITLDTNAAGYNWFIDTTPADNSEYLPTSNPNEWVAKAGSAAAGKMDMLSVLLHEYGHALGIDHSADPNDFMGTTLTAGVRKLPSAEEMALMQGLVAQAKSSLTPTPLPLAGEGQNAPAFPTLPLGTSFIGFLGLLRGSRYGGVSIAADANTLVTQYDWAANATLTNGNLTSADGWSTLGSVDTFTYRLSDGPLESNLATVSISLTAVNDAPLGTSTMTTDISTDIRVSLN